MQPHPTRSRFGDGVTSLPSADTRSGIVGRGQRKAIRGPFGLEDECPPLRVAHAEVIPVMPEEFGSAEDDVEPDLPDAAKTEVNAASAKGLGPSGGWAPVLTSMGAARTPLTQ